MTRVSSCKEALVSSRWGPLSEKQITEPTSLIEQFGFSIAKGELKLLDGNWTSRIVVCSDWHDEVAAMA